MKDPYLYKSTIPLIESKTVRGEGGGWGRGLGNNVSDTMRGVNGEAARMVEHMDETATERQAKHLATRRTDAYKLARAKAKRAKRATRFAAEEL